MFKSFKSLAAHMMKPGTVPMEMKAEPVSESVTEKFYRNLLKEGGIEMVKSRRYKKLSNIEIIGIDHGNSQIKTVNEIFPTGIKEISTEPPFFEDILEIKDRYYLTLPWKLHNMILSKEVAEMRHGLSHCLETNRVVYGISEVVRQIVSARCPQDTTA